MQSAHFLQSDCADPFALYRVMQSECPVFHDEKAGIWALYRHEDCRHLLQAVEAEIPMPDWTGLSETSQEIGRHLARLANGEAHAEMRAVATALFRSCRPADPAAILGDLIGDGRETDWVATVAKRLPLRVLLQGFGFALADREALLEAVPVLTGLMLPKRSEADCRAIDAMAEQVMPMVTRRLQELGLHGLDKTAAAANLIGLLIQSYDAGRGLLTNALVQMLERGRPEDLRSFVIETLRFDPPIHNTRRRLVKPMRFGDGEIPAGSLVLAVLAAANRDPSQFADAERFDPARPNNGDHLTFGTGGHRCLADHMMVGMTADALWAFWKLWPAAQGLSDTAVVEPLGNARLLRRLPLMLR